MPASAGRRVRRSGRATSPASGPASAAARCLNCSVVAYPSPMQALTAAISRAAAGCPPAAPASTFGAPARDPNACSSIAPAYRDRTRPSATAPPAPGTRPPPAPPPAAPAPPPGGTAAAGGGGGGGGGGGTGAGGTRGGPGTASGPGTGPASAAASGTAAGSAAQPGSFPAASSTLTSGSQAAASPCRPSGAAASAPRGPSRRPAVVPAIPSRRPISRSLTPAARHCRARSSASPSSVRGRPGPGCFTSACEPSRSAAACNVDTYGADRPNTSATRVPPNPASRAVVTAKFRITTSDSAYSASTADPTITAHRPAARSRCRSQGSGMSSSIARVTARMPHHITDLTIMQHSRHERTPGHQKRNSTASGDLGLPSWSDKLVGEVVRLLLEAYYEPVFPDSSHGFRRRRGCHTALRKINDTWTGTVWFIEGDISDCLDPWSYCSFADCAV